MNIAGNAQAIETPPKIITRCAQSDSGHMPRINAPKKIIADPAVRSPHPIARTRPNLGCVISAMNTLANQHTTDINAVASSSVFS